MLICLQVEQFAMHSTPSFNEGGVESAAHIVSVDCCKAAIIRTSDQFPSKSSPVSIEYEGLCSVVRDVLLMMK